MKKLLIGFFLLMWGFFLNGHGRVEAHVYRAAHQYASPDLPDTDAPTVCDLEQGDITVIHRPSTSDKAFIKIDATEVREENEDEDGHSYNSFRRHIASHNYTSSILLAQLLGYFSSTNKKIAPFCKYFSYTSSDRYLAFLVFRI
jgi:hypothetical protein